jgi:hypothetical protein
MSECRASAEAGQGRSALSCRVGDFGPGKSVRAALPVAPTDRDADGMCHRPIPHRIQRSLASRRAKQQSSAPATAPATVELTPGDEADAFVNPTRRPPSVVGRRALGYRAGATPRASWGSSSRNRPI